LLLDETLTIAEVAYQLGFNSPSYFSTSFKARYQISPSEYRALHIAPVG
jgi:AraC-like DNA-binding protein